MQRKNKLADWRKEKNKTLEEMALETGLAPATISRYERNLSIPRGKALQVVEKYFNLPAGSLINNYFPWWANMPRTQSTPGSKPIARSPTVGNSLCLSCMHLYGGSVCDGKKPIPGWVAQKRILRNKGCPDVEMYNVSSCPLFERGRIHPNANEKYLKTVNHY